LQIDKNKGLKMAGAQGENSYNCSAPIRVYLIPRRKRVMEAQTSKKNTLRKLVCLSSDRDRRLKSINLRQTVAAAMLTASTRSSTTFCSLQLAQIPLIEIEGIGQLA
jgi:hypothetical protein